MYPSLWHHHQILTCILLIGLTSSANDPETYIVYMGDKLMGVESTELLHNSMIQKVLGSKFTQDALLHSYKKSFNGFVARLTKEEAVKMAGLDGVVSVIPNKKQKLHTTRSWDFLGFPQHVKRTSIESDIIVGIIDSGIWPESDSFNDQGFSPPPQKWRGSCHNFTCNNKIIGARYIGIGKNHMASPRDLKGHGTHCASIVAGNHVNSASLFGLASGTARGGVPSARIAVYKVGSLEDAGDAGDILDAFDTAIADGVDIISISMGTSDLKAAPTNYFEDIYAIGAFHAMKKQILTSKSASNFGPGLSTMTHYAPWTLSVAASTIDRKFSTKVQLGDGMVYEGVSLNTFDLKSYPLIFAGDATKTTGGYNDSLYRSGLVSLLDHNLVKGKIVLCDEWLIEIEIESNRQPQQSCHHAAFASRAAGILIRSTKPKDVAHPYALPTALLSQKDGNLIHSYIKLTSNPTATIFMSNQGKDSLSPYIASFSSRGPNTITPNTLKPDVAAPGVDIIAAWSPGSPISHVKSDDRVTKYNIDSGTSMACPHATAAAAYIKSFHPDWSPAAIKSALMTTATPMSAALNPEAEFAYGAGQIDPINAVNPGLVYDASEVDYVKFLCGQNYDIIKLRAITGDRSICTPATSGTDWDLNLPSFALFTNSPRSISGVFHRVLTNVGSATSRYKAKVIAPPSLLNIQVQPDVLSFSSVGQKESFTLTIEGEINVNEIVSSSLVWDDGTFQVRSPIVVYNQLPTSKGN